MDKVFLGTLLAVLALAAVATGTTPIKNAFLAEYPDVCPALVTAANGCYLCHTSVPSLNPYGSALASHSLSFTAIENLDSDGDGVTNINEINQCTLPGDASSHLPVDAASWSGIKALYR